MVGKVFSVRQLQEKSKEQSQPLYLTFVYLTKAFDNVCSDGLFIILKKIGYSTKIVSITKSFHTNMKSTVNLDGETPEPFPILSVVKQGGCVLAPALQDLLIPPFSFIQVFYGRGLSAYSSRWLFNLNRFRGKSKAMSSLQLFSDDVVFASHTHDGLQSLMNNIF